MVLTIILVDCRLGSLMKKSQQVSDEKRWDERKNQTRSNLSHFFTFQLISLFYFKKKKTFLGRTNVKRKELGGVHY